MSVDLERVNIARKLDKHWISDTKKAALRQLLSPTTHFTWCEGRTQITIQLVVFIIYFEIKTQNAPICAP